MKDFYYRFRKYGLVIILLILLYLSAPIPKALLGFYYYNMSEKNIDSGNLIVAESYLLKLNNLYNDNALIKQMVADFYFYYKNDYEWSFMYYREKLSLSYDKESHYNLCLSHYHLRHNERAINCYLNYIKKGDMNYIDYYNLATLYYRINDIEKALYYAKMSYNMKNDCHTAELLIELNYIIKDKDKKSKLSQLYGKYLYKDVILRAIKCNRNEIEKGNADHETFFYLSMLYYEINDIDNALKYLEQSYKIEKECKTAAYLIELNYVKGNLSKASKLCDELKNCSYNELKKYPLDKFVFEECYKK